MFSSIEWQCQRKYLEFLLKNQIWIGDVELLKRHLTNYSKKSTYFQSLKNNTIKHVNPENLFFDGNTFLEQLILWMVNRIKVYFKTNHQFEFRSLHNRPLTSNSIYSEDLETSIQVFHLLCSGKEKRTPENIIKDHKKVVHFILLILSS